MSSRKKFLYQASAFTAGTVLSSAFGNDLFTILKNRMAPSDQVNIGVIGINGMGWSDLVAILKVPGVNLVALCDDIAVVLVIIYQSSVVRHSPLSTHHSLQHLEPMCIRIIIRVNQDCIVSIYLCPAFH